MEKLDKKEKANPGYFYETVNGNRVVSCGNTFFFSPMNDAKLLDIANSQTWDGAQKHWNKPKMRLSDAERPLMLAIAERIKSMQRLPVVARELSNGDIVEVVFDRMFYKHKDEGNLRLLIFSNLVPEDRTEWMHRRLWTCEFVAQPDPDHFGFLLLDPIKVQKAVMLPVEKIKGVRIVRKRAA